MTLFVDNCSHEKAILVRSYVRSHLHKKAPYRGQELHSEQGDNGYRSIDIGEHLHESATRVRSQLNSHPCESKEL